MYPFTIQHDFEELPLIQDGRHTAGLIDGYVEVKVYGPDIGTCAVVKVMVQVEQVFDDQNNRINDARFAEPEDLIARAICNRLLYEQPWKRHLAEHIAKALEEARKGEREFEPEVVT